MIQFLFKNAKVKNRTFENPNEFNSSFDYLEDYERDLIFGGDGGGEDGGEEDEEDDGITY